MNRLAFLLVCLSTLIGCRSYTEDPRDRKFPINDDLYEQAVPITLLKKDDKRLQEASGLAVSRANPGYFWSHNDSGDGPHLYLFDREGQIHVKVILEGIQAIDWEELSIQTKDTVHYLYIGDIGDNEAVRENISLYRIKEPLVDRRSEVTIPEDAIETMTLRYAEGARDAESFFYDSIDDQIILITKREQEVLVYSFAFETQNRIISSSGTLTLRNFTSADILPNGDLLVKNYDNIFYWERSNYSAPEALLNVLPERIPYIKEPQGEAICVDEKGNFYTLSERSNHARQEVFFYQKKD